MSKHLESMNLVGEHVDTIMDHIFACHDELRRLRIENKMLADTLLGKDPDCKSTTDPEVSDAD